VFDDGRSHLQGTDEKYDLILSEPSNPWLAGVASLFTREFYEICRKKLGDRGILGQWIQLYSFSEAEYALVIRTVTSTFKHAALLRISASDTVLLASDSPLLPDRATIDASQKLLDGLPDIQADLKRHLDGDNVRSVLLPRLLLDEAGLKRLAARTASAAINTDLNLRLEFDAPLRLFNSDLNPDRDVDPVIVGVVETPWLKSMIEGWGCTKEQTPALRSLAATLHKHGVSKTASDVLDLALAIDPGEPGLVTDRAVWAKDDDLLTVALAVRHRAPDEALRSPRSSSASVRPAVRAYRAILELHPGSATAWEDWGAQIRRTWDKAGEASERREIDPLNATVKKSRDKFEKREKK
jgi:hypothetical protein